MLPRPLAVLAQNPTSRTSRLLTRVCTRRAWSITFYSLISACVLTWILAAALDYPLSPAEGVPLALFAIGLLLLAAWDNQLHPPPPITANARRWFFRLIIILAALQLGDIVSTSLALSRGAAEANPAASDLLSTFGQPLTYAAKIIVMTVAAFLIYRYLNHPWVRILLGLLLLLSALVVANNLVWLLGWGPVPLSS